MAKAFTIIETVIAVLIVSVVGIGVMGSGSNYTRLFGHLENKSKYSEKMSIVGLNVSEDFKGSSKTLNDFTSKYNIKNDKIIDYLKDIEFKYDETKPKSLTSPKETSAQKWEEIKDSGGEKASNSDSIQFGFVDASAQGEHLVGKILSIRQVNP